MPPTNRHETREHWLQGATNQLRSHFEKCGYPLPHAIRFAIAFTSAGKRGKATGEAWDASASADGHHEIIIRADFSDPLDVLSILAHQLVHAALPPDAKHGPQFKSAATRIGLEGKMREAAPGPVLRERLNDLAASLGPLPHARLDWSVLAVDRPKKQSARLLKAECQGEGCGYTARITAKWVRDLGPPGCPKHGPMHVDLGLDEEAEAEPELETAD